MSTYKVLNILRLKRVAANNTWNNIVVMSSVNTMHVPIHFIKPYPMVEAWDDILQSTFGGVYEIHIDNGAYIIDQGQGQDLRNNAISNISDTQFYDLIDDHNFLEYCIFISDISIISNIGKITDQNGNVYNFGLNVWQYDNTPPPNTLMAYVGYLYATPISENYYASIAIPPDTQSFEIINLTIGPPPNNTVTYTKLVSGIISNNNINELNTIILHVIINYKSGLFTVTQPSLYKVNRKDKYLSKNILPPTGYGYTTEINIKNSTINSYEHVTNFINSKPRIFFEVVPNFYNFDNM